MRNFNYLFGAGILLLALSGQAAAVVITNGSFEGLPGSVNRNVFNNTLPAGWTTIIQSPDTFNAATSFDNFAWSPSNDGGDFAHIIGLGLPNLVEGFVQTGISGLIIGQDYEISFEQSISNSNFAVTGASGFIEVDFGGVTQNSTALVVPALGAAAGWMNQTLIFTATAMTQDLTFTAIPAVNGQRVELAIDGVAISAVDVPEPTSLLLLSLGLAGLGFMRKLRY